MRPIPLKTRKIISEDPFYSLCCRRDEGDCAGRITIEHAIVFAGRQLDHLFSLLPVCEFHHAVCQFQDNGNLNKEKHTWIALNRATDDELRSISKAIDYIALRERLNKKYGIWQVQ